jgi:hypothetical protein
LRKHQNENFVSEVAYKIQDIVAQRVAAPGEKMAAFLNHVLSAGAWRPSVESGQFQRNILVSTPIKSFHFFFGGGV